jgi:superfamily II DNA helicase RecQ
MLNAFRQEEKGMTTIVVVPLLALQLDLEYQMKEKGVKVLLWTFQNVYTKVNTSIQVVLVVSNSAAQPAFKTWLLN